MDGWRADAEKAEQYLPAMKQICGEYLIQTAPFEEDALRNSDLIVLKLDAVRIGCRVRSKEYGVKYPGQFTIRTDRPSGTDTEHDKIMQGWGDYFLYAIAGDFSGVLSRWMLGSLNVFRRWWGPHRAREHHRNRDGSSEFDAYHIKTLPPDFLVASFSFTANVIPCPRCKNVAFTFGQREGWRRCDGPNGCGYEFPEAARTTKAA